MNIYKNKNDKNKNTNNRVINALYGQLKILHTCDQCDRFLIENKKLLSLQDEYNQYICNTVRHLQWMIAEDIEDIQSIQNLPHKQFIQWSQSLDTILSNE